MLRVTSGILSILWLALPVIASDQLDQMIQTEARNRMLALYESVVDVRCEWAFAEPTTAINFDVSRVRLVSEHPIYPGNNTAVSLAMYGDSGDYTVREINVTINLTLGVLVANKALDAGQFIQKDDVLRKLVTVDELPAQAITDVDDLIGKKLQTRLLPGHYITQRMLYDGDTILPGQAVTVIMTTPTIQIEKPGTARSSGKPGEYIQVDTGGMTVLEGEIIDDKTVRIN